MADRSFAAPRNTRLADQAVGYKPLTTEVKRQIFGLNAARLFGVDPKGKRNPVPGDYVDRLKKRYAQAGGPIPSNTQYGWVAAV